MLLSRSLQHPHFICGEGRDNAKSSPNRNVERNGEEKNSLIVLQGCFKYKLYVSIIYEREEYNEIRD